MGKYMRKIKKGKKFILGSVIILLVIMLSVGFSAFQKQLLIDDATFEVRIHEDVRVSSSTLQKVSGNAVSNFEDFNKTKLLGSVQFPSTSSYVLYKVDLTNYGNVKSGLLGITNNTSGTSFSICDSNGGNCTTNVKTPVCSGSNCTLGSTKEIYVKVQSSSTGTKTIDLDFNFQPYNNITYNYFRENTSSFSSEIMSGDTYTLTLTSKPEEVEVLGTANAEYNKTTGVLTISDVGSNITISARYKATDIADSTYTGSDPDNYVLFGDELYRIITKENIDDGFGNTEYRVKIIRDASIGQYPYDDDTDVFFGSATINDVLNTTYYNNLSETQQNLIDTASWHFDINDRDPVVTRHTTAYFALINKSDFTSNSSWLNNDEFTMDIEDSEMLYEMIAIQNNSIMVKPVTTQMDTYPVTYLKSDTLIVDGEGTRTNPYVLDTSSDGLLPNPTKIKGVITNVTGSSIQLVTVTDRVGTPRYSLTTALNESNYTSGSTTIPTASDVNYYNVYFYIPAVERFKAKSGMVNAQIKGLTFTAQFAMGPNITAIGAPSGILTCTTSGHTLSCPITLPSITPASGYESGQWSDGSNYYDPGDTYTLTNNSKIFTAQVSGKTYTAALYKNGATSLSGGDTCASVNADACISCQVTSGSSCSVTLPTITRSGFTIDGWNDTSASAQVKTHDAGSVTLTGNKSFYAITHKDVTITFNRNGNTSQTDSSGNPSTATTVTRNCTIWNSATTCSVTSPTIVMSGFTIDGYSTGATTYSNYWTQNTGKSVSANATWFAQSTKAAVNRTMTLYRNGNTNFIYGGTTTTGTSRTITMCTIPAVHNGAAQGTSCTASNVTMATITPPSGFSNIGWSAGASDRTKVYSSGETIATLTMDANKSYYAQSIKACIDRQITFYKNNATSFTYSGTTYTDTSKSFTVCTIPAVYNGASQNTSCSANVTMPTINTPNGYTPKGWETSASATSATYQSGASVSNLSMSANRSYYALMNASPISLAGDTFNKSFSAQDSTNQISEAAGGSGSYSYAITAGNSNNYFSLNGRTLTTKANTPVNTYNLTITATDSVTGAQATATYSVVVSKIPSTLTLAESTKTLTYKTAGTVSYTYDGDGTVSCQSANTSYVTCSVNTSTKVLTLTPVAVTSNAVTVTLKATAGTNYNAPTSKTISVTVNKFTPTVSLSAKTGMTWNNSPQAANTATVTLTNNETYNGTINYKYYTNSSCTQGETSTAPTLAGEYYVRASIAAFGNYNAASSSCVTHSISLATPTITLSAKTTDYTGQQIYPNNPTVSPNAGGTISFKYYTNSACTTGETSTAPTNAGQYYAKATVGEVSGKTSSATSNCASLKINKISSTITPASTTKELSYPNTGTVSYTYDGDGVVSCESANTSYVTCNVNTTTKIVTLTPVAVTANAITVTLKATSGTNYSAPSNKTISVTVSSGTIVGSVAISGTKTWGQTLTATPSCSTPNNGCTFSNYQWYYSNSASNSGGTAISGATSSTYTIDKAYASKYIYVTVRAAATGFSNKTLTSDVTTQIAKQNLDVTRTNYDGTYDTNEHSVTVKVNSEYWNGGTIVSGTSTNYGNTVTSSGAVGTTYTLLPKYTQVMNSTNIYFKITGGTYYNDYTGSGTVKISQKKATITPASSTKTLTYPTAGTVSYTYDGDGTVSCESANTSYVTCSVNTSTKVVTLTPVATTSSAITVTLKATSGTNYSAPDNKTISVTVNAGTITGSVTISGSNAWGQTLTANPSCSVPSTGCTFDNYQWYYSNSASNSGGTAISGATSNTYTIDKAYVSKYIYVTVRANATNYTSKTLTSSATSQIAKQPMSLSITNYNGTYNGQEHGATVKVYSQYWDGATIVSGTTTSYGSTVTSSGAVGTTYTLLPKYTGITNAATVYFKITGGTYYNDYTGSATVTISKGTCTAPASVSISTAGVVTWPASASATSYQISIAGGSYTAATSGTNYKDDITASTGTRSISVRSVCDTTYYTSGTSSAITNNVTVYSVALQTGTGISAVTGAGNYISGASVTINATVESAYTWSKWIQTSGGSQVTTTKNYTFTINSNRDYTAVATGKTFTATIYYNSNTTSGSTTITTATATCTVTSGSTCTISEDNIPAVVKNSVGKYNSPYHGVSSMGGMGSGDLILSGNTTFYANYSRSLTIYYPHDSGNVFNSPGLLYRNEYFSASNTITVKTTNDASTTTQATTITLSSPKGTFRGLNNAANSTSYFAVNTSNAINSSVSTYYAVTTANEAISFRINGSASCGSFSNTTATINVTSTYYCASTSSMGTSHGSSTNLPSSVTNSVGFYNSAFAGVSSSVNSMTPATTYVGGQTYYAFYSSPITIYYPISSNGVSSVNDKAYRNEFFTTTSTINTVIASSASSTTQIAGISESNFPGIVGNISSYFSTFGTGTGTSINSTTIVKSCNLVLNVATSSALNITFKYNSNSTCGSQTISTATLASSIYYSCTSTTQSTAAYMSTNSSNVPSAVSSSTGRYGGNYVGVSSLNSVSPVTTLTAGQTYYALYRSNVSNNYYNGTAYANRTLYRNEYFSNATTITARLSTEINSSTNYTTAGGPGGSTWAGLSTGQNTTTTYTSVQGAASSCSNTLYTVYTMSVSYQKGSNVSSIGANSATCKITSATPNITYGDANGNGTVTTVDMSAINSHLNNVTLLTGNELLAADVNLDGIVNNYDMNLVYDYASLINTDPFPRPSCLVTLPSITPNSGYNSLGWSLTNGASTMGTAAGEQYAIDTNPTTLYANAIVANYQNMSTNEIYSTLHDAFSAAANNQTIKVLQNTTETSVAYVSKSGIKLDLNGKTISVSGLPSTLNSHFIDVVSNGELDIYNSSSTTGTIYVDGYGVISNDGLLTLNGTSSTNPIVISQDNIATCYNTTAILYNESGSTTTINNNVQLSSPNCSGICSDHSTANTIVNGGQVGKINLRSGNVTINNGTANNISVLSNAILTINGGTVFASSGTAITASTSSSTTVNIYGGTITGPSGVSATTNVILNIGTNDGNVNANSPLIEGTGTVSHFGVSSTGTFNFYDGIIKSAMGTGKAIVGTVNNTPDGYDVYKYTLNGTEIAHLTKQGILMNNVVGSSPGPTDMFLTTNVARQNIETITFENVIIDHPFDGVTYFDVSKDQDGSVIARVTDSDSDGLKEITIGSRGKVYIENGKSLFEDLTSITAFNGMQYFDTSKTTNMGLMFENCSSLVTLDLNYFDTSKVTNMSRMFVGCGSLTSLNLSSFDTSKITSFSMMFYNCSSLISLDLSSFDTSNVTRLDGVFSGCSSLTSLDVSNWNTSKVTDMSNMFKGCSSLTSLDLSNFNTSIVTDMYQMFNACSNLSTIFVGPMFSVNNVTNSTRMFSNCTNLAGGNGTTYSGSNPSDKTYAHIDGGTANPGYFTMGSALMAGDTGDETTTYLRTSIAKQDIESITFSNTKGSLTPNGVNVFDVSTNQDGSVVATYTLNNNNKYNITIHQDGGVVASSGSALFASLINLGSISGMEYFNTSYVATMRNMFRDCQSLTTIDLSHFDTSNVVDMKSMFSRCISLTSLNVSYLDTSNVTTMDFMFYCSINLTSLDISSFNTSNVTTMLGMFAGYDSFGNMGLTQIIGIETIDTSNVTNIQAMFQKCSSLTTLDLSGWNTSSLQNMYGFLLDCGGLTSINLTGWDTTHVTDMTGAFQNLTSLTTLDLSSFSTPALTATYKMFEGDSLLTTINATSNFDVSNVTNSSMMFNGCTSIRGGNGTTYSSSNIDKTYARIDAFGTPGYFTGNSSGTTRTVTFVYPRKSGSVLIPKMSTVSISDICQDTGSGCDVNLSSTIISSAESNLSNTYIGMSTTPGSMTPTYGPSVTSVHVTGDTELYLIFRKPITETYYNGTSYTTRTLYKNMYVTNNNSTLSGKAVLSSSTTGLTNISTIGGPNGSSFVGYSSIQGSTLPVYSTPSDIALKYSYDQLYDIYGYGLAINKGDNTNTNSQNTTLNFTYPDTTVSYELGSFSSYYKYENAGWDVNNGVQTTNRQIGDTITINNNNYTVTSKASLIDNPVSFSVNFMRQCPSGYSCSGCTFKMITMDGQESTGTGSWYGTLKSGVLSRALNPTGTGSTYESYFFKSLTNNCSTVTKVTYDPTGSDASINAAPSGYKYIFGGWKYSYGIVGINSGTQVFDSYGKQMANVSGITDNNNNYISSITFSGNNYVNIVENSSVSGNGSILSNSSPSLLSQSLVSNIALAASSSLKVDTAMLKIDDIADISTSSKFLGTDILRGKIKSVRFENSLGKHQVSDNNTWDVSNKEDGSILLWVDSVKDGFYNIVIGQEGGVVANSISKYLFSYLYNLESISFKNFDTINVLDMAGMFYGCANIKDIDFKELIGDKVINLSLIVSDCDKLSDNSISSLLFKAARLKDLQSERTLKGLGLNYSQAQKAICMSDYNSKVLDSGYESITQCKKEEM